MFKTLATLTAACALAATAPLALADPEPGPPPAPAAADAPPPPVDGVPGPPPDNGVVGSEEPSVVKTPDGWVLTVGAKDETQLAIPPLTTALSSREYLSGGTFTGTAKGGGGKLSGGTLEAGYQIGCGISLNTVKLNGSIGLSSSIGQSGLGNISMPIQGQIEVHPQPGEVINVSVDKKKYKGSEVRITLKDVHIKIDGCIGQSFLRSYAVLTSSSKDNDDIVGYYGVTKTV
ncbi:MspA family porin [Mycobacterium sp. CBMA271]|uniref:MspA family porin n=1 Tax=unclassified Mycobacteroides TaxID=2618759 RepID=UPI0012DCBD9A|nr:MULTISPECIES: MspA family porin [unclassified Mycobacteroides]MUM18400.1 MspA protein [Mycobacteroides sp. CBMA 326]MUM23670.1 MspA family porin [Mycobacteroides sp. CBMA 271]